MKKVRTLCAFTLVATLAFSVPSVGWVGQASAAPLVGTSPDAEIADGSGATNLRIVVTPGNPDIGGGAPAGQVGGITIQLDRLEDIDPFDPDDVLKVQNTVLEQILTDWPTRETYTSETDADGQAVFPDLRPGIYTVRSVTPEDGTTYREFEPFLVMVPMSTSVHTDATADGLIITKTRPSEPPTTPPEVPGEPPTTPPDQPGEPGTPGVPPEFPSSEPGGPGETPSASGGSEAPSGLAMTGAQIIELVLAGLIIIGAGLLLLGYGKRTKTQGNEQ